MTVDRRCMFSIEMDNSRRLGICKQNHNDDHQPKVVDQEKKTKDDDNIWLPLKVFLFNLIKLNGRKELDSSLFCLLTFSQKGNCILSACAFSVLILVRSPREDRISYMWQSQSDQCTCDKAVRAKKDKRRQSMHS